MTLLVVIINTKFYLEWITVHRKQWLRSSGPCLQTARLNINIPAH